MDRLNQALFYSIVKDDFQTAKKLLDGGANPNAIFQLQKGKFTSSFNLFITKTASVNQKKGSANTQYKACMELMKQIIPKSTLQCKCQKQHRCPLYIALQTFKITDQTQILQGRGDIIRFLIINGASLKFQEKHDKKNDKLLKHWKLPWIDINGIRSYLVTKKFDFVEAKV